MKRCFKEGWKYIYTPLILEAFTKYEKKFLSINFIVAIRVTIVWGTGASFFGYSVAAPFCPRRVAPSWSRCGT